MTGSAPDLLAYVSGCSRIEIQDGYIQIFQKQQKYAPLYSLIGTGHREISCRLTDRVFDNISVNLQKLDSLGNELRDGSTGTFIMFQLRPKALSWNRSANLRGKSFSIFPVAFNTYPLANPTARWGVGGKRPAF